MSDNQGPPHWGFGRRKGERFADFLAAGREAFELVFHRPAGEALANPHDVDGEYPGVRAWQPGDVPVPTTGVLLFRVEG